MLVNLYRNGEDYVGWHANNEQELGEAPFVASLTLLTMQPNFQHHWLHSVPMDKSINEPRVNLTFRKVMPRIFIS